MALAMIIQKPRYLTGISFMMVSTFMLAISCLVSKELTSHVTIPLLISLRFLAPLLLLLWLGLIIKMPKIDLQDWKLYAMRGCFIVLTQYCLIYYLSVGSLLNATVLLSTGPLFVPIISSIVLKTKLTRKIVISLLLGFTGVLLILKPTEGIINIAAFIGLGAGFFNACSQITLHKQAKSAEPMSIIFYSYLFAAVLALIPLLTISFPHSVQEIQHLPAASWTLLLLVAFGVLSVSNQVFRGKAYSKVRKAQSLSPFIYCVIIFSGLLGWLVYDEVPDIFGVIGIILIILGGVVMVLQPKANKD